MTVNMATGGYGLVWGGRLNVSVGRDFNFG